MLHCICITTERSTFESDETFVQTSSYHQFHEKTVIAPQKFLNTCIQYRQLVIQNFFCCASKIYKLSYFLTKKLLVSVGGLFNAVELIAVELFIVVELFRVEDAPFARCARYGRKIHILECCRF